LSQAWPVWAALLLIGVNAVLYCVFRYEKDSVHRVAGIILQIVGGAFVLFSLNKNIGVFNQGTLGQRAARWWSSRPFRKRPDISLQVQDAIHIQTSGSAVLLSHRKIGSIEERVKELEKRIKELRKDMKDGEETLRRIIESAKQELKSELLEKGRSIAEMKSLLKTTVVGSVNAQFFGILLVFYGTALPLF
jgi:hypothetical protein